MGRVSPLVVLVGLVFVCAAGLVGAAGAAAGSCPNETLRLRLGRSASLPDCRGYELVTPTNLGRTQALTFTGGSTFALVAGDGERVALETLVPLEPNPSTPASITGTHAVFSRNPASGWEMTSVVPHGLGAGSHRIIMKLFSPDLSYVALEWQTVLNEVEHSPDITFEVGPLGGPYTPVTMGLPRRYGYETEFLGTSADFGHVLFVSVDHDLLSAPTGTDEGARDLYDWTGRHLELVNVKSGPFANPCGATLGGGAKEEPNTAAAVHAVSADGSKIFFTSPAPEPGGSSEAGCQEPTRLYMRVNDSETVDVSEPEPEVHLAPSEFLPVRYNYASPDGSKVFFNTETALTSDDTSKANKLFEYDTEEPEGKRLKLIASGVPMATGVGVIHNEGFIFSESGSTVYVEPKTNGDVRQIYRIDTSTGTASNVATAIAPTGQAEPSYTTANGEFFLFTSRGVEGEPRGAGHDELYRYDNATGSVMCVSCGAGVAPEQGEVFRRLTQLETPDVEAPLTQLSENGQEVFFQTTAQLVPQDTNSTETNESSTGGAPGLDVYEWEAYGTGGCELGQGCTHLLSSGEASGPSTLLGASEDGSNVFLESPAQLTPQATPEFPNVYDARVGGGFAPPPTAPECLSCQGVGNPPLLFSPGASLTFAGTGNLGTSVVKGKPKQKKKPKHKKQPREKSKAVGRNGRRRLAGKKGRRS